MREHQPRPPLYWCAGPTRYSEQLSLLILSPDIAQGKSGARHRNSWSRDTLRLGVAGAAPCVDTYPARSALACFLPDKPGLTFFIPFAVVGG